EQGLEREQLEIERLKELAVGVIFGGQQPQPAEQARDTRLVLEPGGDGQQGLPDGGDRRGLLAGRGQLEGRQGNEVGERQRPKLIGEGARRETGRPDRGVGGIASGQGREGRGPQGQDKALSGQGGMGRVQGSKEARAEDLEQEGTTRAAQATGQGQRDGNQGATAGASEQE